MSNNNNNNTAFSSNPLSKEAELKAFESSFFPAGGAPKLANIPQAPPAPKNLNNVKSKPLNLKTRNWGGKLENGYSGINRSLYDRPNVFYWDSRPVLNERAHVLASSNNNNNLSNWSSSSSNIPQAPRLPQWNKQRSDNYLIKGKRLRLRNWGNPTSHGWSGMNRELYNREGGLNLELNVIINELWAKFQPKNNGNMERGLEQQQFIQQPVKSSLISTVTTTQVVPLVNATTVPVPMLNPPINDGRVYSKLYSQNTAALTSGTPVTSIVKPRGTRRDHLVQPTTGLVGGIPLSTNTTLPVGGPMIGTGTILAPGITAVPLVNRVPSKKELKTQQKLLKKQNKRDAKLMKKGILPPTTLATPALVPVSTTTVVEQGLSNGYAADRGLLTAGGATTTGIIGPVATTVLGGSPALIPTTNSFIKQDSYINVPTANLVGSPMM